MSRFAPTLVGIVLLASLAVGLAACSSGGKNSAQSTTAPAPTSAAPTTSASPSASPAGTPDANSRLAPPYLDMVAASGKQEAMFGTYYWQLPNGLAAQVNNPEYNIHPKILDVNKGETVHFAVRGGAAPATLSYKVYPYDGNTTTGTNNGPGTPAVTLVKIQTDSITGADLSAGSPSWSINLDPGKYFVIVHGTWTNPKDSTKPLNADWEFLIQVA